MGTWQAPLLGRKVRVAVWRDGKVIEKARHWWQSDKHEPGRWIWEKGEVVDRSPVSAQYLVALEDGSMDWHWSESIKLEAPI